MIIVKDGVQIAGLLPILNTAINITHDVFDGDNKPLIITSALRNESYNKLIGGKPNSKHLTGEAIDISITGITHPRIYRDILSSKLFPLGFDVVLESNHIHIEYDPKEVKQ